MKDINIYLGDICEQAEILMQAVTTISYEEYLHTPSQICPNAKD